MASSARVAAREPQRRTKASLSPSLHTAVEIRTRSLHNARDASLSRPADATARDSEVRADGRPSRRLEAARRACFGELRLASTWGSLLMRCIHLMGRWTC